MKKAIIISIGILSIFISGIALSGCSNGPVEDGKYAEVAQCITEKGAKFYGTFWCGFCKKQKSAFGDDIRYIDYVECDERGDNGDPQACIDAGVDRYPTWFFPGQGLKVGLHSPEDLAKITNCEDKLPGTGTNTESEAEATTE